MTPLPIKTAADRAGVNRRTLQRWIRRGHLRKLPDGKVDLDEVSNQIAYLLAARRRGPAPGQRKPRPDPWSDDEMRKHALADSKRFEAAKRMIKRIEDPFLVYEIAAFAGERSRSAMQKIGEVFGSAIQGAEKISAK